MRGLLGLLGLIFVLPAVGAGLEPGGIVGRVIAGEAQRHPVVVFVPGVPGQAARATGERPVMDQRNRSFGPHVLPVGVGTTVEFRNSDPFKHNIFSPDGERYNLGTWDQGQSRTYTFRRAGIYRQLCNIHPEMLAYILVLDARAFVLTDGEGRFDLPAVPAGRHTVRVWGEKLTPAQLARGVEVMVAGGKVTAVEIDLRPLNR